MAALERTRGEYFSAPGGSGLPQLPDQAGGGAQGAGEPVRQSGRTGQYGCCRRGGGLGG